MLKLPNLATRAELDKNAVPRPDEGAAAVPQMHLRLVELRRKPQLELEPELELELELEPEPEPEMVSLVLSEAGVVALDPETKEKEVVSVEAVVAEEVVSVEAVEDKTTTTTTMLLLPPRTQHCLLPIFHLP